LVQEQLDSLASQVSYLTRKVAATLGWLLVDIYLDIKSDADTAGRSAFQRMTKDCRAKKLDIVVTKSISRVGRNTADTLAAINELRLYGGRFTSIRKTWAPRTPTVRFKISKTFIFVCSFS